MAKSPIVYSYTCTQCGKYGEVIWCGGARRRLCSAACKLASFRAANPDKVAASRAKERAKERARKPVRLCQCGEALAPMAKKCGHCKRADDDVRRAAKSAADRRHRKRRHSAVSHNCRECGDAFVQVYGDKRRVYCSIACQHKSTKRTARLKRRARERTARVESVNPFRVFERDGWRCYLCGTETSRMLRGTIHPLAPELDHIIPLSKGGEHSYSNTACSCRRCNAAKSDKVIGQPSPLAA